jgi:serine/threonine-protein kinase
VKRDLEPEAIVSGCYLVENLIGAGGQGTVYRVIDLRSKERRALKLLAEGGDPERFQREARLGQNLRHANLVEVFDTEGQHRGRPYFVMELLEGFTPLGARWSMLDWKAFLVVAAEVASALDFLASYDLVHRDLSPRNILVGPGGRVKVIDLGLAREESSTLTRTSNVLGTPGYLPPEQLSPKDALPASDQWALGAIVYERLTGTAPYRGRDDDPAGFDALERLADGLPLAAPSDLNPTIGKYLNAVVLRALAANPRHRFPSATAFIHELSRARSFRLKLPRRF